MEDRCVNCTHKDSCDDVREEVSPLLGPIVCASEVEECDRFFPSSDRLFIALAAEILKEHREVSQANVEMVSCDTADLVADVLILDNLSGSERAELAEGVSGLLADLMDKWVEKGDRHEFIVNVVYVQEPDPDRIEDLRDKFGQDMFPDIPDFLPEDVGDSPSDERLQAREEENGFEPPEQWTPEQDEPYREF